MKCYLLAHGTDPEKLDEITLRQITTMYSDGMIGNAGILEALGNLTAGVYNYMRAANSKPYKLRDIISRAYDYIYPPQDSTNSPSDALLAYMTQARGFKKDFFKGG